MRTFLAILALSCSAFAAGGTCPSASTYTIPGVGTFTTGTLSTMGVTSCYFFSAAGSDSNTGTTEGSPCLHAPGMPNAPGSGSCHITPAAGEGFIFRIGDDWHVSASTSDSTDVPMGGAWSFPTAGSSGSPIYIGVDPSWTNGGGTTVVINADNALSTSVAASCTYDDSSISPLTIKSYTYVDTFEFTGKCWSANISSGALASLYIVASATNSGAMNSYFHGNTLTYAAFDAHHGISSNNNSTDTENFAILDVFDYLDSTGDPTGANCTYSVNTTSDPCASGWAIGSGITTVINTVVRYASNGFVSQPPLYLVNSLFEHNSATFAGCWNTGNVRNCATGKAGPHPNSLETIGGITGETFYFYGNLFRNNDTNVHYWPQGATLVQFDNVFYAPGTGSGNCFMQSPPGFTSGLVSATSYIQNNTLVSPCTINFYNGNSTTPTWDGPSNWENNHLIGFSAGTVSGISTCTSPSVCTFNDNGGEEFMSSATATSQGYTSSNNYGPTSGTNSTVGHGNNMSAACAALSNSAAAAACVRSIAGVTYNATTHTVVPGISLPRGANWDSGAYQYSTTDVLVASFPAPSSPTTNFGDVFNGGGTQAAVLVFSWASIDTGGCPSSCSWSAMDTEIGNMLAAYPGLKVVPLVEPASDLSPNTFTPSYVMSNSGTEKCGCTQYPGSHGNSGCFAGNAVSDTTIIPVPFTGYYNFTQYNTFIQYTIAHLNAASYVGSIAYAVFGVMEGGENYPQCTANLQTLAGGTVANLSTSWLAGNTAIASTISTAAPAFPVLMGIACLGVNSNTTLNNCSSFADGEAAIWAAKGIGLRGTSLQANDISEYALGHPGSSDWVTNFNTYAVPTDLQDADASNPAGACTSSQSKAGNLVPLMTFVMQHWGKSTMPIYEAYYDPDQQATYVSGFTTSNACWPSGTVTSVPYPPYANVYSNLQIGLAPTVPLGQTLLGKVTLK